MKHLECIIFHMLLKCCLLMLLLAIINTCSLCYDRHFIDCLKGNQWGKMAQWVKVLVVKPDELSLTSGPTW